MKKEINILALLVLASLLPGYLLANPMFGKKELIANDWKFILDDSPALPEEAAKWETVNLPHDWSVEGQLSPNLASCTGYLPGGIGWYKKNLKMSEALRGKKVYIYFEGVYNRSEVYINGHLLGKRPNGYISFMYDLTPYLKYGADNTLAVRVDHSRYADSRWYTGSGIYRNVYLVEADPVHIAQWGVYAYPKSATKKQAVLQVEVEIENGSDANGNLTVSNELLSMEGKTVAKNSRKIIVQAGQKGKMQIDLKVGNPQLWSIDTPNLYQLKTTLLKDGKVIDETMTRTGLRAFTFDPDKGFALNGEWMKVKGVCIHHDAGVLGAAVPADIWRRRLSELKKIGCNAVRTSHNPQAPDLYNLCDELGLLVLNEAYDEWEFPKRKWIEGWNTGTPLFQGSYDFFEEWGEKDLADMVRRDRNHVSVFAWSIGNEVDYPNDPYSHPILDGEGGFTQAIYGGYQKDAPDAMRLGVIAKKLAKVVKEYDKSRPVTAGLAGVAMSNETEYPGALDIAGYNYTESRYDSDHEKYPNRVIYGSENRHDMEAWKAVRDREHIFGQFLWTGIDYLGESGRWPSRGFYSGLLDFGGNIKPRGYFRQSLWADQPMAYIGTYPIHPGHGYVERTPSMDAWPIWNYAQGQPVRVVCYTNAAKARLELNGKVVGTTKDYDDNTGIIYWDIPYEDGKLEVVGLDVDNREIARNAIHSSKRPYALTVVSVEKEISKDRGLAQVVLQVVDEDGIPVMISDNEVACHIVGPAKLLGLEASNNSDMGDYTDSVQRVFHGHLLAYIQATGEEGTIHLKFTSPWLKEVQTNILAK
ncbi:sugar-binding domain-containing protein [Bacteroides sp.]